MASATTRVLVTGATGFAGSYLTELCLEKGSLVFATRRRRSPLDNLEVVLTHANLTLIELEIEDARSVGAAIKSSRPDMVFHLAAQSFVPSSFESPHHTMQTNILGTLALLEAVRQSPGARSTRILIAGSSEEYGLVKPEECPITESQPLRPLSPYGVSKVACDLLGNQYYAAYGMHIVRTRAFNHEGARRGVEFVTSDFAHQAVQVAAGKLACLKVGNLDAVRDFSHVRDIVAGYWLALEKGEAGDVYNLCSGKGVVISGMISMLEEIIGRNLPFRIDRQRLRPADVPLLLGDSSKFRALTGWTPKHTFEDALTDLVAYWREHLQL